MIFRSKREMLKDIASMANYRGGYLLTGIDEDDEGIPANVAGIEPGNHDSSLKFLLPYCVNVVADHEQREI